jgi:hypothetical protein
MKTIKGVWSILFLMGVLLCVVYSQEQHPFVGEVVVQQEVADTLVKDVFEDPTPPPIWSLCGIPSQHLLIP